MNLAPDVLQFDPYTALGVTEEDDMKTVRGAYRKLAKTMHPDLNQDDPKAEEKFTALSKAYKALTDETSRNNWQKYGNPDGPQQMSVRFHLVNMISLEICETRSGFSCVGTKTESFSPEHSLC